MRQWLAMYKYRGDEKLAEILGGMLSVPYQRLLNEERSRRPQFVFDAVTYIPLSRERQEERGFNQAEQMARCLGEKHSLPVVSLLRRTKDTEKLSCQTRTDRFRTMAAAFAIDPAGAAALRGESKLNLLLVDDVYTTGSTLNSAAKTIASELNARIYGLTWAR
jgi:predicted amidophosphoribosyltransferase